MVPATAHQRAARRAQQPASRGLSQVVAQVVADFGSKSAKCWSEWQDLNLRPPRPERGARAEGGTRTHCLGPGVLDGDAITIEIGGEARLVRPAWKKVYSFCVRSECGLRLLL